MTLAAPIQHRTIPAIDDALRAVTDALNAPGTPEVERRDLLAAQRHLRAAARALEPTPSLRGWDWRP